MKTDETRAGELLDRYRTASDWTLSKIAGAAEQLDAPTLCDGWDVATLRNHMLEPQQYFLDRALGHPASAVARAADRPDGRRPRGGLRTQLRAAAPHVLGSRT